MTGSLGGAVTPRAMEVRRDQLARHEVSTLAGQGGAPCASVLRRQVARGAQGRSSQSAVRAPPANPCRPRAREALRRPRGLDLPGIAGVEERREVALAALGLRGLELRGHELVVHRALDAP